MTCRADRPQLACVHRRLAVLEGRFRWRSGHGWVWRDSRHPDQTWDRCPWCDGTLADLDDAAITRLAQKVRDWMANGWPHDTEADDAC